MEILRNFAVFEGGDGSGTSTQLAILKEKFAGTGSPCQHYYITAEPTDCAIGRLCRNALEKELIIQPETLARLYAADRGEHLFAPGGIIEHCQHGELVISDRYVLSSLVYQGIDCGEAFARSLNASYPAPELILYFDIDPEIAQKRMSSRKIIELFDHLDFQMKVRERYLSLLDEYQTKGVMVGIIDASQNVEMVAQEVWSHVSKMPIIRENEELGVRN